MFNYSKITQLERMVCFRCNGKGHIRNEFGLMEKCESCQKSEMKFEKVNAQPDSNEEDY